jgi:glycosyltransferase involved in cell wall biosynthesis
MKYGVAVAVGMGIQEERAMCGGGIRRHPKERSARFPPLNHRITMLRVCHLGKYYPPAYGGMETHVAALARAQRRLGADVTVFCVNHQTEDGREVRDSRLRRSPTREEIDDGVRVVRYGRIGGLSKLDLCPKLRRLSRELEGFDVVHLHAPNPTFSLPLFASKATPKLCITHHSDVIKQRMLAKVYHPLERRVYGSAANIFATSPWYLGGSPLLQQFADKVDVVPLGVNVEPYLKPSPFARSVEREIREGVEGPIWLCVGRLVYYKGFHTAIDALARVPGTLVIVGKGPLEKPLKAQAEKLGVADRVRWCPDASDDVLCGLYHAATALWFPSNNRSEGFGLVQVEAMASGLPVINTSIPNSGVAWVAPHEVAALTIAPESPHQLAEAALRLLEDDVLRRELGANGRRRAKKLFSDGLMAQRYLDRYTDTQTADRLPTATSATTRTTTLRPVGEPTS